ncbi:MAG: glycosyltransferase family 2 protein [Desulfobacterales bacterium]
MKKSKKIDVIVPVFNEEMVLHQFYRKIRAVPLNIHLTFIDNASTDKSLSILKSFTDATVIEHDRNEGYGASICDGIRNTTEEIIAIIDADCEYPPESLPEMVAQLDRADVVYASRFLKTQDLKIPYLKSFGNKVITGLFNLLFSQNVTDLYTGCKVLKRSALEGISLERKGFEHVLELGTKLAKKGVPIAEVHVDFSPRQTGRSKMKHLKETSKYIYLIFYYFFNL